jgi:hypothetical protein
MLARQSRTGYWGCVQYQVICAFFLMGSYAGVDLVAALPGIYLATPWSRFLDQGDSPLAADARGPSHCLQD